jgi:hypothetical protein
MAFLRAIQSGEDAGSLGAGTRVSNLPVIPLKPAPIKAFAG